MIDYVLLAVVVSLNLFLGILTIAGKRKEVSNISFFLLTLALSIWCTVSFFEDQVTSLSLAHLLVNLDFSFALILAFLFLVFASYFLYPAVKKKWPKIIALSLLPTLIILTFSTLIIQNIVITSDGLNFDIGPLFWFYAVALISFVLLAVFFLIKKLRAARGLNKAQLRYVTLGLSVSATIAVITNLVLPRVMSTTPTVTRIGIYSFLILIGSTSYAIVKHRLMDIRLIIIRSISFSVLLLVLISGFAFPLFRLMYWAALSGIGLIGQITIGATAALAIGYILPYVRKGLTKATDAIFFKQEYDPEVFHKQINDILSSNIVLSELLHKTLNYIIKEFRLESGMFVVTEGDKVYSVQSIGYKQAPRVEFKDAKQLSHFMILAYDELEEGSHIKNLLRKYETSVMVPLMEDRQFAGILFLGEKKSGDMFSSRDISTLEIVAPEIAMAMQRAKQYEEIQKFNVTLKAEVLRATKKLQQANEHLKELDHAKDEFISMASHQLRTPLTAIKGYLSMLLEGDAGDIKVGQYDFINEAFTGANKMVALINDLLNVSRMSTGKFFIDPKEIDMKALINDEIRELANTARQKGLYLKFEHPKKMPIVEADENKIRQVVMNFIDNAIYYTNGGGITVKAMANKHDFVLEVIDTGAGVPREAWGQLFTKFYRAENAKRLRPDGNGLGLYLAKRVIEDHGGEIIFKSTEGKGSVFGFRIPIKTKIKTDPERKLVAA